MWKDCPWTQGVVNKAERGVVNDEINISVQGPGCSGPGNSSPELPEGERLIIRE